MGTGRDNQTEQLLQRAAQGDRSAAHELFDRYRDRLRQMVSVRLDPRLAARVDPSDVVQESLMAAAGKLSDYLTRQPLPFYPWLRQITWERLVHLHSRHVGTRKRSVNREMPDMQLSDASLAQLVGQVLDRGNSPSEHYRRKEERRRLRRALDRLHEQDREVLVMRFLEQLSVREVAAVLGISEGAVRVRQLRALERLQDLFNEE